MNAARWVAGSWDARLVLLAGVSAACFSLATSCCGQQISIDALRSLLDDNTVTGATIITHGYQAFDSGGDALMPLAQAIHDRQSGWLIDYDVTGGKSYVQTVQSTLPGGMNEEGHAVILFDWARESDEAVEGWVEAAGDALFSLVVNLGLADPKTGIGKDLHFIGHSFGTAVTSEAVERLARYAVPVDQVTYLDLHEFDQPFLPDDPSMTLLGEPAGYGATSWNNVAFTDTYYETRGTNASGRNQALVPRGRPIPGAYNLFLNDGAELPDDGDGTMDQSPYTDLSGDHSYVWSGFYQGTVEQAVPTGQPAPEGAVDLTTTGYNFSKLGLLEDDALDRPNPVFFGAPPAQDHAYSDRDYATETGTPGFEVPDADAFTAAKYAPRWDRLTIFNGNFESAPQSPPNILGDDDYTPGWDTHTDEGGGISETATESGNTFLVLTETGNNSGTSRTHNRMYVPHDVRGLEFDLWIPTLGTNDAVNVLLDDTSLGTFSTMTMTNAFATQFVSIPQNLRNDVLELTFRLDLTAGMGTPVVRIDNVRYSLVPEPGTLALLLSPLALLVTRRSSFFDSALPPS